MQHVKNTSEFGFSLLEIMAVVSIIAILAVISIPSYRSYTIRSSIAALMTTADKAKYDVEEAHNQGTIFGTSGNQTYIANNATDKPYALLDMVRGNYGCVNISIDTAKVGLDTNQAIVMVFCPSVVDGSIEWKCGYGAATYASYVQYLPSACQVPIASIQDTAF